MTSLWATVNTNLVSLKFILFLVFGAVGCLYPFLPLHMDSLGLSKSHSITISMAAPLIAILGPIIAAPLADTLAGNYGSPKRVKNGAYLRIMIAVSLAAATVCYWLLFVIPVIKASDNVTFICNKDGGFVLQDKCGAACYNWQTSKGSLAVKNCIYSCNATSQYTVEATTSLPYVENHEASDGDSDFYDSGGDLEFEIPSVTVPPQNESSSVYFEPHPHLCYKNDSTHTLCEVYTEYSNPLKFEIGLKPSVPFSSIDNRTCKYPTIEPFQCRIRTDVYENLTANNPNCEPIIICEIDNPYTEADSLLKRSQCGNMSFWLYILIRSLADCFLAAAIVLLGAAVVIATRETSAGRGDLGKQYAVGSLGFAIFPPIIGYFGRGGYMEAVIGFTCLIALAVMILILDDTIPLSPPEWWWHTRSGLLALPMSSVRNYGMETASLGLVLLILGVFWNSIDAYIPWSVVKLESGQPVIIGLVITISALPAVIFLIFAERIVDYCGHNNILISCFVSYVCHHVGLMYIENAWVLLSVEWLEVFTLHIMYITAVLYLRHLVPRKYTACGQALPIVTHFCLGRCIGSVLGGLAFPDFDRELTFQEVHKIFSIVALCLGAFYFVVYHFYMKPKCRPPVHLPPAPAPAVVQNMNGNGSYTPLRVYHNSKSKKGHFRY